MTADRQPRPTSDRLRARDRALALALWLLATTALALAPFALAAPSVAAAQPESAPSASAAAGGWSCGPDAEPFVRTELYFGSGKPDGSAVTEAEFQRFLDQEITPRFPDGLTLLTGLGQFRGSNGRIVRERSMLLILLYPVESEQGSGEKIEQIRTAYKRMFQQESVLRADAGVAECVSF